MIDRPDNINIFILYAREDEPLKKELEDHLGLLQRLGYIDVWHEGQVQPGVEKEQVVAEYLDRAHIILLLISANFLAPDTYTKYESELRRAYERQKRGEVNIIPVILRHCVWQLDILAGLNPLPSGGHPVRSEHWESADKAFHDITMALQKVAIELKKADQQNTPPAAGIPAIEALKQEVAARTPEPAQNVPTPADAVASEAVQSDSVQRLLDDLFDALFSISIEEAMQKFIPIAHRSLLKYGALEPAFKKNNFDIAYQKARDYKRPPRISVKKSTGRRKIGPRKDKDEGIEYAFTLVRIQETGAMPGQVRIFQSVIDGTITISGLSL